MSDHEKNQEAGAGRGEPAAGDREVDPAENPGPRGNQEPDPERVDRERDDLDRAGAN
jgi:hypothetical protein